MIAPSLVAQGFGRFQLASPPCRIETAENAQHGSRGKRCDENIHTPRCGDELAGLGRLGDERHAADPHPHIHMHRDRGCRGASLDHCACPGNIPGECFTAVGIAHCAKYVGPRLLRQMVRDFTREAVEPQADEHDRTATLNVELLRRCGDLGLLGVTVPSEHLSLIHISEPTRPY